MKSKIKSSNRVFFLVACVYTFIFLVFENFWKTDYPWILYCIPALVMWILAVTIPHFLGKIHFAFFISALITFYYLLLNIYLAPGHPWFLYIAFAIAWYPLSLYFGRKHNSFLFSMFGMVWSTLFFTTVNLITTPNTIWAVYPIFAVMWWPLACYFFVYKKPEK